MLDLGPGSLVSVPHFRESPRDHLLSGMKKIPSETIISWSKQAFPSSLSESASQPVELAARKALLSPL